MKTENDLGNQQFTVRTSKEKEFCSSLKLKVILVVSICPRQSLVFPLCPRSFCSRPLTRMPDYRDWRRSSRNYSQETIIIPVRWARWLQTCASRNGISFVKRKKKCYVTTKKETSAYIAGEISSKTATAPSRLFASYLIDKHAFAPFHNSNSMLQFLCI